MLVYLPQEGRGIGLVEKIKAYALQDQGLDTVEANLALGYKADSRDYGVGIQLLKDLGLRKVRLLTNNPKKTDAFIYGGFDLEVVDQVPIVGPIHEHNAGYLATKRDKMGHQLPRRLSRSGSEPGRPRPRRNASLNHRPSCHPISPVNTSTRPARPGTSPSARTARDSTAARAPRSTNSTTNSTRRSCHPRSNAKIRPAARMKFPPRFLTVEQRQFRGIRAADNL